MANGKAGGEKGMTIPPDWRALNQANWDERVGVHLNRPRLHYNLDKLRAGTEQLDTIAAGILGPVDGLRVLHLQCHFGADTLTIAQQGAAVTGLDFSPPAIEAARSLAIELGLADRARFVEANVYDAEAAIDEPAAFDRVFVRWGALCWLPERPRLGAHRGVVSEAGRLSGAGRGPSRGPRIRRCVRDRGWQAGGGMSPISAGKRWPGISRGIMPTQRPG